MMSDPRPSPKPIDLGAGLRGRAGRACWRILAPVVERALAIDWVNRCHDRTRHLIEEEPDLPFFHAACRATGLRYEVDPMEALRLPATGPVVVVANHPFGGADAIVLADLLLRARPDTRVLGNRLLNRLPGIGDAIIAVDPFSGTGAAARNRRPLRDAFAHLKNGGVLVVFPAGEVSSWHLRDRRVCDRPWSAHAAKLARRAGAAVLPVHFEGRNGFFFQASGLLHPRLRTLQLARELRRRARPGAPPLRIRVGKPIPPARFPKDGDDRRLTEFFRLRTDVLAESSRIDRKQRTRSGQVIAADALDPLAPPEEPGTLRAEIEALPPGAHLASQDNLDVYVAEASQIPSLLREIGRLREATFRQVGEGTGRACDLDSFDHHYLHLFLWDRADAEIAGAYRLGLTDVIVRDHGLAGLYTRSLFKYTTGFLARLDPAIELGRSFVTSRYQKKISSLLLLWKGISTFVARNPRYRIVFGPVSISQDYHSLSRSLIVRFMRDHLAHPKLSRLVKAQHPPKPSRLHHLGQSDVSNQLKDIEDVNALISEIEGDGKGIPILLKHYVKMNAALLSFNVDPAFNGVLDGLMVADLCETDPKLLRRYMGTKPLEDFLAYHSPQPAGK